MQPDDSLPSYVTMFDDPLTGREDESRSVYSPAAYLADLLQLLGDEHGGAPAELLARRPDIERVPLDAANTSTKLPYLEIVNEVLGSQLDPDGDGPIAADDVLAGLHHPVALPFSAAHERVRRLLRRLGVDHVEFYRQYAFPADPDTLAREELGLTPDEVRLVTSALPDGRDLRACYGLADGEAFTVLADAHRFRRAMMLSAADLRVLLAISPPVTLDPEERRLMHSDGEVPVEWFERAHRFVRLARRAGLPLPDLALVLSACCDDQLNDAALRKLAAVTRLRRDLGLPTDAVVSLVSPALPAAVTLDGLTGSGDLLAPRNAELRRRMATALAMAEPDLAGVVRWYRRRTADGPFDTGTIGAQQVGLLRRIGVLATALGVPVADLLALVELLDRDPSVRRWSGFDAGSAPGPDGRLDDVLLATDVDASLWLVRVLAGVTGWLRVAGFGVAELTEVAGAGDPTELAATVLADLRERFVPLDPELFVSERFSERAAQVVHSVVVADTNGVVSARDDRLLRLDPAEAVWAAYAAVAELAVLTGDDFAGLGLGERLATKVFTNLVLAGYLDPNGALVAGTLPGPGPGPGAQLRLAGEFGQHRDALFELLADVSAPARDGIANGLPAEPAYLYPSDLVGFGELTDAERAELYDNLVFNDHLDPDGRLRRPEFFDDPGNIEVFAVDADLTGVVADVLALLQDRAARFGREPVALDTAALAAAVPLDDRQSDRLAECLRFNGYLDADGRLGDPAAVLAADADALGLPLELYPLRRQVLTALRDQLLDVRAELTAVAAEDFAVIADRAVGEQAMAGLEGTYLVDGRVPDDIAAYFADPAGTLDLPGFTAEENATLFGRVAEIVAEQSLYHVDLTALTDLGFPDDQRAALVDQLVADGDLNPDLTVPDDRLEFFGRLHGALEFTLDGLEDYAKDVFFLLHGVATEVSNAVAEIVGALTVRAEDQRAALFGVLQDALGVPAATAEVICTAVTDSADDAVELLVAPALAEAPDPVFRRTFSRIAAFAQLAATLDLDPVEVAVVYDDQDLVGKFPEPLALPPGVDRIDALLQRADGSVLLFRERAWWAYAADTYALVEHRPRPLSELSPRFAELAGVDAAFVAADGVEWLIGRDTAGATRTFVREPGGSRWSPRQQAWGAVANAFDGPGRIDAAFVDSDGRTYLFRGDQYVRFSGDLAYVDEGYPRRIEQWWEGEPDLPAPFRSSLDAAFRGTDGTTYLFSGQQFLAVGADAEPRPVAGTWGRVPDPLGEADRVDAAYTAGRAHVLVAGEWVVRHTGALESDGLRADAGYPRSLEGHLGAVPAGFEGGLDAAFREPNGVLHLFKDGRTVALGGESGAGAPVATASRWGRLGPVLADGTVDAALLGMDGRTYLFSGGQYVRYSRADYSVVDLGHPRGIAQDWAGLRRVDVAFVLDSATHLFGAAGRLLELPTEYEADLDRGRVPRAVRDRLAGNGITLPGEPALTGRAPEWRLTADNGITLVLRQQTAAIAVECDPNTEMRFHVRYSTRDYTRPDTGYPRPLADNWWNLPDELIAGDPSFARIDAVLTDQDGTTRLFAGKRFVTFDTKHRWWLPPRSIAELDSMPFERVDAAFVGKDGRTYLFSGDRYARWSDDALTRVDDRYPAPIVPFWGNVANSIARTGQVDAALVLQTPGGVPPGLDTEPGVTRTYLFCGDQYVRYTGTDYDTVDLGYPRALADLRTEPRLGSLDAALSRVDGALADRRTVHLFSGRDWYAASDAAYRRYDGLGLDDATCALIQDGAVVAEHPDGWRRHGSLEGEPGLGEPVRPRVLRTVPAEFRTGLDAVLHGADGNTYLFKGGSCFDTRLKREVPVADEWGRARNTIYEDDAVDAAFVAADGGTYVFRGDQFVSYASGADYAGRTERDPLPIAEHWGGLRDVAVAFVRDGLTYLFEHPDADGTSICAAWSGSDYTVAPDEGYPVAVGADFWGIPEEDAPGGFVAPDAVLVEDDSLLLIAGRVCLQRDEPTGTWSRPRPLDRVWPGIGKLDGLTAAFTARDGSTYFFFPDGFTRCRDRVFSPRVPVRDHWGRPPRNGLTDGGPVDAAVVVEDGSYLFCGDQYIRYSTADYRYVDAGYPKPIAGALRTEPAFAALPVAFDEELRDRAESGARALVDAVVAVGRTVQVIVGGVCHAASRAMTAHHDIRSLGRVRNVLAERGRVDAALVTGRRTLLFSGDQYVRYSGSYSGWVDEGYPREIGASLPDELGIAALPDRFADGIDAAFTDRQGRTILFGDGEYLCVDGSTVQTAPIAGEWGVVRNALRAGAPVDAAFPGPDGELYVFAGDQYVRYEPGEPTLVAEGYPRSVRDSWGNLPADFEAGIEGAFVLEGRTYFAKGAEYVRYSHGFDAIDRTMPQPFAHRWADAVDHRLADIRAITRFVELARSHPDETGGLAGLLSPDSDRVADPYEYVAGMFGWDVEELRWCRRHSRFLSGAADDEDRFELEFLLETADLFRFAGSLGSTPSQLEAVWARLHETGELAAAGDALHALLVAQDPDRARALREEMNVARRDALVPAVLAIGGGLRTPADLFERFLLDVEMGGEGITSRVREAIAATQLYVHRYLLNLERGPGSEAQRQRVKAWWSWMRNYRVWEANRKVFLYPENYLRPELRPSRTPAFRALQSDLLQGELTARTAEQAYKRYLDEYTEVSRLTIAGGYVYTKDREPGAARRLVLFGRTKTDPRRYYYRRAEFGSGGKPSANWEPWQRVDLRIDADQVRPVHAFGRVFVFWATVEAVPVEAERTTVVVRSNGAGQQVSGEAGTRRVVLHYSFLNLSGEWVSDQTLGTGPAEDGTIDGIALVVRPRTKPGSDRTSILVSCGYTVTVPPPAGSAEGTPPTHRQGAALLELNPELYAEDLLARPDAAVRAIIELARQESTAAAAAADRVTRIFLDPVNPADVVRFDHPDGAEPWPWFSVDVKGGSFLCRPVPMAPGDARSVPLAGNSDRLPDWRKVDAAVELPDRTRYFFDDARGYATAKPDEQPGAVEPIADRWGRRATVLTAPGPVDAVLTRGTHTFVFSGSRYVRFTGTPFGAPDPGYPKPLRGNPDGLPSWPRVDVAFTDRDGVEFFAYAGRFVTSREPDEPKPLSEHWTRTTATEGFGDADSALVTDEYTFVFSGEAYVRYSDGTTRGRRRRGRPGDAPDPVDEGYPRPIAGNPDGLPVDGPVEAALWREGTSWFFTRRSADRYLVVAPDGTSLTRPVYVQAPAVSTQQAVDAAWVSAGRLYLTRGRDYVRYTLDASDAVPDLIDEGYPKQLPYPAEAAFTRDGDIFLFSGTGYARLAVGQEPEEAPALQPAAPAWGDLPRTGAVPFDAALDATSGLYLIVGASFLRYPKTDTVRRPYELTSLPFELIRLTTGTASELNRRLLSGGVPALLDLSTQEIDEVAVVVGMAGPDAVGVRDGMVDSDRLPTGSHLDFRSANGLYYWEIFFHAPFLVAQALNAAQRFEDAKQWYEFVFDPTNPDSYWRFLPFLTVDLEALADTVRRGLVELGGLGVRTSGLLSPATRMLDALLTLGPVVAANREPATEAERSALLTITADPHVDVLGELQALRRTATEGPARDLLDDLVERVSLVGDLVKQFDLLGDREALLATYRDDPFDPHAIADLRPVAYRRAVVAGYVDNLLDWGDMLFRQYTPESVDEARMLYVLAHDLLGDQPDRLGTRLVPAAETFGSLVAAPEDLDLVGRLTAGGAMVAGKGAVHAGVANEYFHVPPNTAFDEYWARVADRLAKIRASLTILGTSQPLPLFSPPIDPMALVTAAADGAGPDAVVSAAAVPAPPYRFPAVFRRAQELTDKLRQVGSELLGVLEKKDAEELSLLQNQQEAVLLALNGDIKQAQIRIAEENVAELTAGLAAANERVTHYQQLLAQGMTPLEEAQLGLMATAVAAHFSAGILKVASGIAYVVPQTKIGPFIIGVEHGGRQLGDSLDKAGEVAESLGEGFSMLAEVLGLRANQERTAQDWALQLRTAQNDVVQIGHQLAGAQHEVGVARRQAEIHRAEVEHNAAVGRFMRGKFGTAELYGWMAGQLAGTYFQTYQLAYELAHAAERAYQFERGLDGSAVHIRPSYWDSRRSGLLAGNALGLDLDRLGQAYLLGDERGLEITKQVSLMELDPLALLKLRTGGVCDFALTEAEFDHDFPGHYRRQIRTVTVAFLDAEGQPLWVNATLTQLGHQTVLEPDPKAVAHLLDPKGTPPDTVRSDWRAGQQIALSEVDGDNNGLFELRYDDERYLPFEGTGAVCRWRLQCSGRVATPPYDVVLTVRYTADQGGDVFANAVRGMLKPYPAARFVDVAREFPDQWSEFAAGAESLTLPLAADLFPGLASRQISGILPVYESDGETRFAVDGDRARLLADGTLLPTPGLSAGGTLTLVPQGDPTGLENVGLVLTYLADVR